MGTHAVSMSKAVHKRPTIHLIVAEESFNIVELWSSSLTNAFDSVAEQIYLRTSKIELVKAPTRAALGMASKNHRRLSVWRSTIWIFVSQSTMTVCSTSSTRHAGWHLMNAKTKLEVVDEFRVCGNAPRQTLNPTLALALQQPRCADII